MANDMGKYDLARRIQNAKHAGAAKALSKEIANEATRNEWELTVGIDVMTELQFEKCKLCPEFIYTIYEYRDYIFAEANPSRIWATGMSEFVSQNTKPSNWIGQNLLGCILNDLAAMIDRIFDELNKPDGAIDLYKELGL